MFNFYKNLFKMAKAKRKRRTRKSLSATGLMAKGKRRTRRTSKKRGLSEAFSPSQATASAKTLLGGAMGGFGYGIIKPQIDSATDNKLYQNGIVLGASFLISAVLKMDNVASGMIGGWASDMAKTIGGLNEMNDTDYSSGMDEPEYLDEMGEPMYLADDGNFYYLDEMNEDEMMDEMGEPVYLADSNFYPEYVNTSHY